MGNLSFFESMINSKLLSLHTAYLAKVISSNGKTAKIQPLGMTQAYNEKAQAQSVLSNVPIIHSARYKLKKQTLTYVSDVSDHSPIKKSIEILVPTEIGADDIVICVCCERDISEAKKGKNAVPPIGHHSMSDSIIVGIL